MMQRATLAVIDHGTRLEFSFADRLRYHGPRSPGGGGAREAVHDVE